MGDDHMKNVNKQYKCTFLRSSYMLSIDAAKVVVLPTKLVDKEINIAALIWIKVTSGMVT